MTTSSSHTRFLFNMATVCQSCMLAEMNPSKAGDLNHRNEGQG